MDYDTKISSDRGLISRLLRDSEAGIQFDSDGRRYHRPRKVEFETLIVDEADIHSKGWMGFDELHAPAWESNPSHEEIRNYSLEASRRFLTYWYRVFDVAVARSLAGRGREIFQKPFIKAAVFFDTGIPENVRYSSVHPLLHRKIIDEYINSKSETSRFRIYYLSDYLTGITDDVIELLRPFQILWNIRKKREAVLNISSEPVHLYGKMLSEQKQLIGKAERILDAFIHEVLIKADSENLYKRLSNSNLRNLIRRFSTDRNTKLNRFEMDLVFLNKKELQIPGEAEIIYFWIHFPERIRRTLRSTILLLTQIHRIQLRLKKIQFMRKIPEKINAEQLKDRIKILSESAKKNVKMIHPEFIRQIFSNSEFMRIEEAIKTINDIPDSDQKSYEILLTYKNALLNSNEHSLPEYSRFSFSYDLYNEMEIANSQIIALYDSSLKRPSSPQSEEEINSHRNKSVSSANKYYGLESPEFHDDWISGNPFHEARMVQACRELVFKRLRLLRRTAGHYSLIPGHRHGAMSLNPILRLWKDKPYPKKPEDPAVISYELNTKQTIQCLIQLACIADKNLFSRTVLRKKDSVLRRLNEDISTLAFFLIPGSCYPVREISRDNFPEFRSKVIGESRNPGELGIDPHEDAVLTGAWYQKNTHSLYYMVGGDNGMLLRNIWYSGRTASVPAFFFALGQFVHDTLDDDLVYYRKDKKTFRNCIEEYYVFEDKIRKNRGEKSGRKKMDNSRTGIRFMFALTYARILTEALSGSSQSQLRHSTTESWMKENLDLPLLNRDEKETFRTIRTKARELIQNS